MSRRTVVAGASAAAASALAAGPAAARPRRAGLAPEAQEAIGVIGTIVQEGLELSGYGWLTHIESIADADLYTDPQNHAPETARFTWVAGADVIGRDILPNLFSATAVGTLRIHFREAGGAVDGEPETFGDGRRIASYDAKLRNVLTVIAPDQAVNEITGELNQRSAPAFRLDGRDRRVGRRRLEQRLTASGPGVRSEPTIPRATFHVAGSILIPA